jgi:ABC-type glycerol-3-phosphate transport system substrate-binding protein
VFTRRRFVLGIGASVLLAACGQAAAPTAAPTAAPAKPAEAPKPADAAKPADKPAAAAEPTKPAAVAAPAPTQAAPAPAAGSKTGTTPVTIRYMERDGDLGTQMRKFSRVFEERNPGITIKNESTTFDDLGRKVPVLLASGTVGDVVYQQSTQHLAETAPKGSWRDVEDYVKGSNHDLNLYYSWGVDVCRQGPGNKLLGVPSAFIINNSHIFYNKTLFQKLGVKEPSADMSVDDLAAAAVAIRKAQPDTWGILPSNTFHAMEGFARSWKGFIVSEDRKKVGLELPETQAAFQYFYDLVQKLKVQPGRQEVQGGQNQMFYGQKVAMATNATQNIWTGFKDAVKDKWELGDVGWPVKPSGVLGTTPAVGANVIWSKSKVADQAWGLLVLQASNEASKWSALNSPYSVPGATIEAWNDPEVWKVNPPYKTVALQLNDLKAKGAKMGSIAVPANSRRLEFWDAFDSDFGAMLYGDKPFDKNGILALQQKLQAIMDKPPA